MRSRVTNENDENGANTRVTRAKAAALDSENAHPPVKRVAVKKAATQTGPARKRAALGDISNANHVDATDRAGDFKKPNLVTKASTKTTTTLTRTALGVKDRNTTNELKRPASTIGVTNHGSKKRNKSSDSSAKEPDAEDEENVAPASENIQTQPKSKVKSTSASSHASTKDEVQVQRPVELDGVLAAKIQEMDEEDAPDPLMVSEYVYEIMDYMKVLEEKTMPSANYMKDQPHLDWRMRGVLIDWLLEVHTRFHLLPETFYLTVNLIDRFLSSKQVLMERLQLVGVTAMFVAAKYEEVLSPHISNFVHVADDGFTEQEILTAERFLLQVLDFDISFPNPMHFMRRISKADNYDIHTRTLAKYLLEISLLDHRFLAFRPSINAAAAMYLSRVILEKGEWDEVYMHYSGYSEEDIRPAVETLIDYLQTPVVHNAFYKKYAGKKFLKGMRFGGPGSVGASLTVRF